MNKKVAIVTGGASGLGLSITQKFAENGIYTIIIARDEEKLKKVCNAFEGKTEYIVCDISDTEKIQDVVKQIEKKHGKIDILVNNAGIHLKKPMLEVTDEEYLKVIQTNQNSVFSLSREVAKLMVKKGEGCILNISSMASQYGIPNVIAYTAAKSAVEGMTRAMAVELSPKGVRVNCIAPGFIETCMSARALNNDPERKRKVLSRTPMNKLGKPEDVSEAAWFLCSEKAGYITGTVLCVDGGNSIGF